MFRMLRAAVFAAAGLVCLANTAHAEDLKAAVPASATVPASAPAAPAMIPASAGARPIEMLFTPGRIRPDHQAVGLVANPSQLPAPGVGAATAARRPLVDLVAEHSAAPITGEEFECLASAVYFESRGEPLEGQLAVAEVIINRMHSGRFRSTICDVVKQPSQFSFVRRGVIPEAPRGSAAWARAVAIAHIALNDLADATGDDSLFFHATYVNPRWGRPRIAQIGRHIFYR